MVSLCPQSDGELQAKATLDSCLRCSMVTRTLYHHTNKSLEADCQGKEQGQGRGHVPERERTTYSQPFQKLGNEQLVLEGWSGQGASATRLSMPELGLEPRPSVCFLNLYKEALQTLASSSVGSIHPQIVDDHDTRLILSEGPQEERTGSAHHSVPRKYSWH